MKMAAKRIATDWNGLQEKAFSMRIELRVVFQER
jgi:hypothetical protein